MDIAALRALLDVPGGHPVSGAYGSDAGIVAGQLNALDGARSKNSMTGDEVFAATDVAEFGALSAHKQLLWLSFCGRVSISPAGASNVALVVWVFGSESATVAALVAERTEEISWATENFLGFVSPGHVMEARL